MLIEGTCASGGGFLRHACVADPVGQCVYCGAPFCANHGVLGVDHHEVCSRSSCRAKYLDLLAHQAWLVEHRPRNASSMCAEDACENRLEHQCQRCQLRFCEAHLKAGTVTERRVDPPVRIQLMLCPHCTARRRIWD